MTSTKRASDYGGLRREPQMWEIVHYLENNQEKRSFPDRQAKFIRNHPFMTQLDFFDMQDEQAQAWEEQNRKERQKQVAESTGSSLALEDAAGGNRRKRRQLAIEDAPGGSAQSSNQLALTQGQDAIQDMARSERDTMQDQREGRSSSMALAVRHQLGGIASNPGTDVPDRIPMSIRMPAGWQNMPEQDRFGRPRRKYPISREELRAMPAAWHHKTEQQQYDSGGET